MKSYLITGGLGFIGSNIAADLLASGKKVTVFDNMYRVGSEANRSWLEGQGGRLRIVRGDVSDYGDVERAVSGEAPDVIFHLAGQVAMTTSIENPRFDFEVNTLGSLNILEAVRKYAPECHVIYASTNKVYGDLSAIPVEEADSRFFLPDHPEGIDEETSLDFHSPYGCSKGSADQYMLDYHRIYGLRTTVFRHSTVYGNRQFTTFDQGWIGWFITKALEQEKGATEPFTISGNGKQVRDILSIEDCVRCYIMAPKHPRATAGQPYNIGGGPGSSLSILELLTHLGDTLDIQLEFRKTPWRASDQKVFISDSTKARDDFGWEPETSLEKGLSDMLIWATELLETTKSS